MNKVRGLFLQLVQRPPPLSLESFGRLPDQRRSTPNAGWSGPLVAQRATLGFIYVDRGIETSKVGRRVGAVAIKKRLEDSTWRTQMLHSRRFAVAIVTPSEHKVATLRARLEREWEYVTFRFHVLPELLLIRDRRRHASG